MQQKMDVSLNTVNVIGAGLAGCEAAWQIASRGFHVDLFEMRPIKMTEAHISPYFAELVCSNSLGSRLPDRPSGLLKEELKKMGSLLMDCATHFSLPAGDALAVDREKFAQLVTSKISDHPNITVHIKEITEFPTVISVISSGPLTSPSLSRAITDFIGSDALFFYDAIAPIVTMESINMDIAFRGSRFDRQSDPHGDYINCPFTKEQYYRFVKALQNAERIPLKDFETQITSGVTAGKDRFFEGCLPVEVIAQRGDDSLAFGPMRPIGIHDPRKNELPYAVVQLRQDNLRGDLYNLVGFQTNLKYEEQKKVFSMIPGLEKAEFVRFGQMHRNSFIASPSHLCATLQTKKRTEIFFAGQITGVEGYVGSIGTGLLAGINATRLLRQMDPLALPQETMLGALIHYITHAALDFFQPMKANFGLLPELPEKVRNKKDRNKQMAIRSLEKMDDLQHEILQ